MYFWNDPPGSYFCKYLHYMTPDCLLKEIVREAWKTMTFDPLNIE